ncbi:MAG: proline racemase family protein [Fuerstiella sp.]
MQKIRVIDSHTGGEPTRLVIEGAPDLGTGPLIERVSVFRDRFDEFRRSVILEPRGSDVHVGALLCEPVDSSCSAGVIFFNNTGYLQMCGHGTIGLVVSLAYLGKIKPGVHRIETSVGIVEAELLDDHTVRIQNVPSYRYQSSVAVQVPGFGELKGDIAWGGNWFFLVNCPDQQFDSQHVGELLALSTAIRQALGEQGITGADGGEIDHVELYRHVSDPTADQAQLEAVNFVLCPGGAWDRSPCGTGTSAKLACLAADSKLAAGEKWNQRSVIGSLFSGTFELSTQDNCGDPASPVIIPMITGSAWVSADSTLLISESDPFASGIPFKCLPQNTA